MITREGNAVWNGDLKQGNGTVKFGSFEGSYTFASRFESGNGTNPEEMIGAAHAGCFSMALANILSKAGKQVTSVRTTARVNLDPGQGRITSIELTTEGKVDGLDADGFRKFAEEAKENCPVSKVLAATEIVLKEAKLA